MAQPQPVRCVILLKNENNTKQQRGYERASERVMKSFKYPFQMRLHHPFHPLFPTNQGTPPNPPNRPLHTPRLAPQPGLSSGLPQRAAAGAEVPVPAEDQILAATTEPLRPRSGRVSASSHCVVGERTMPPALLSCQMNQWTSCQGGTW